MELLWLLPDGVFEEFFGSNFQHANARATGDPPSGTLSLSSGLGEDVGVLSFGMNLCIFLFVLVEVVGCILPLLFVVSVC
jgi:hypothetical protein